MGVEILHQFLTQGNNGGTGYFNFGSRGSLYQNVGGGGGSGGGAGANMRPGGYGGNGGTGTANSITGSSVTMQVEEAVAQAPSSKDGGTGG